MYIPGEGVGEQLDNMAAGCSTALYFTGWLVVLLLLT